MAELPKRQARPGEKENPPRLPSGSSGLALLMFGVLLASYVMNAMDRQLFPLLAPDVRREYGFSLADIGLVSTVFTLGMAVAGLPTGFLLARYSRKTVLQSGVAIFSAGNSGSRPLRRTRGHVPLPSGDRHRRGHAVDRLDRHRSKLL